MLDTKVSYILTKILPSKSNSFYKLFFVTFCKTCNEITCNPCKILVEYSVKKSVMICNLWFNVFNLFDVKRRN